VSPVDPKNEGIVDCIKEVLVDPSKYTVTSKLFGPDTREAYNL
jgi:hypothetical protein